MEETYPEQEIVDYLTAFFDDVWGDQEAAVLIYTSPEHDCHFSGTKQDIIGIMQRWLANQRATIEA